MIDMEIERMIVEKMLSGGQTLAVAESCTGGWISKLLTDIPGVSVCFLGGIVSYTDAVKNQLLGVSEDVLNQFSAVSEETARQMAIGVREKLGSTFSLATTGYAGPEGDPVGLVYIAVCNKEMCDVRKFIFSGDRTQIRSQACDAALHMLYEIL